MDFCRVFLLTTVLAGTPALAEFTTVEEAIETSTAWLKVPTSQNSRLMFKTCEECEEVVARLTPATRYKVGENAATFSAFRSRVVHQGHGTEDYALVIIDVDTNTVTDVEVAE